MKLSNLKNIIKETVGNLIIEQTGIQATAMCPQGYTVKRTNPVGGVATQTTIAMPMATYSIKPGDEICFTCVPVEDLNPDPREPFEPMEV